MQSNGYKAGQDTLILNGYTYTSIGTGDAIVLDFPEELTQMDVTYNNQIIQARNARGSMATLTIIVPVGSGDDLQTESFATQVINNFVDTPFLQGTYSRITADTQGNLITTTYVIIGGTVKKIAGLKTNSTGDTTQLLSTWEIGGLAYRQTA